MLTPLRKHRDYSAIPYRQMVARLETIPMDQSLVKQFYNLFAKWSNSSGPLWAVERTKMLRDCFMQSRSVGHLVSKPEWVATTQSGNLKGVYGKLLNVSLTSFKGFKSVMNLLQLYTVWTANALDDQDAESISQEIGQRSDVGKTGRPGAKTLRKVYALWHAKGQAFNNQPGLKRPTRLKCKRATPLLQVLPGKRSHAKQVPIDMVRMNFHYIYERHTEAIEQAIGGVILDTAMTPTRYFNSPEGQKWQHSDEEIAELEESWERKDGKILFRTNFTMGKKDHVGNINVSHEPGLKTRYFAAPNVVIQRALEPLKDSLLQFLDRLPWDCTKNQRKADSLILSKFREGSTVHTVDMSKATDNFPWEYQKQVLRMISSTRDFYTEELVQLFIDTVEKGEWHFKAKGARFRRCTWGKGQPLGLGPSFPIFTITHGMVLFALNEGRWDQDFFVLGDDVIILNDDLATKYKKWLSMTGVTISVKKSFSSKRVGQFAGKTYTPYGAFWAPKWNRIDRSNVLDTCAWWFKGLSRYFPKDQILIDKVLSLPHPLGNGWNPGGVPLSQRFTSEMVDNMLELEEARNGLAKPTSAELRIKPLRDAMKMAGFNSNEQFLALDLFLQQERAVKASNRNLTSIPVQDYHPETEVPGYPRVRFKPKHRVDPYSIGPLKYWKQIFKARPEAETDSL